MRATNPRDTRSAPSAAFATLLLVAAVLILIVAGHRAAVPAVSVTPSPTPYHEGVPSPIASPGAALYPLERALVSAKRESPSTELMVCRRR